MELQLVLDASEAVPRRRAGIPRIIRTLEHGRWTRHRSRSSPGARRSFYEVAGADVPLTDHPSYLRDSRFGAAGVSETLRPMSPRETPPATRQSSRPLRAPRCLHAYMTYTGPAAGRANAAAPAVRDPRSRHLAAAAGAAVRMQMSSHRSSVSTPLLQWTITSPCPSPGATGTSPVRATCFLYGRTCRAVTGAMVLSGRPPRRVRGLSCPRPRRILSVDRFSLPGARRAGRGMERR